MPPPEEPPSWLRQPAADVPASPARVVAPVAAEGSTQPPAGVPPLLALLVRRLRRIGDQPAALTAALTGALAFVVQVPDPALHAMAVGAGAGSLVSPVLQVPSCLHAHASCAQTLQTALDAWRIYPHSSLGSARGWRSASRNAMLTLGEPLLRRRCSGTRRRWCCSRSLCWNSLPPCACGAAPRLLSTFEMKIGSI